MSNHPFWSFLIRAKAFNLVKPILGPIKPARVNLTPTLISFNGYNSATIPVPIIPLKPLGFITLEELDWITENENSFSRIDMALVIKLGRLIDQGVIEIDCRKTA